MRYILLTLLSALLLSISWPTYGISIFIFISLVPLLMMEHTISKFSTIKHKGWVIFGLSYLCFVIWNAVTTGWLYGAKNPDGSNSLMAVLFPVLVNSFLYTIVFQCYHWYKNKRGTYWGLAFFVAIWMSFEKFHLGWEFTWPWLNLGNVFSNNIKWIQWYDTLGATGGSFWILIVNVFIFYSIRIWEAGRNRKDLIKNLSITSAIILFPIIISYIKYYQFEEKPIGTVDVMMLQPRLDPYQDKYTKDSLTILTELLTLAQTDNKTYDYYIAPETAIPGRGSISEKGFNESMLLNTIRNFVTVKGNSNFVTGASTHKNYFSEEEKTETADKYMNAEVWRDDFNSALQISPSGPVQTYHKGKLVPGVEIFPYIHFLKPILGDAMLNLGGTVSSLGSDKERKVFTNTYNKGIVAPIICYESIYGEFTTEYVNNGANFLAIMTNDSWWGVSEGHKQLISYAKLRAIETRREIARAANSGISAHINAQGEVIADTFYGDQTTLAATITLYDVKTFYTRTGDLLSRISIFALGFLLCYALVDYFRNRKTTSSASK